MKQLTSTSDLKKLQMDILAGKDPTRSIVAVCISTGCDALGAREVLDSLKEELKAQSLEGKVDIRET